ncbi:MAG: hypothetical protein KDB23_10580 [Planctomycetales bacterium]|nr:hypothetical protein [Planctomycetales bacterium]
MALLRKLMQSRLFVTMMLLLMIMLMAVGVVVVPVLMRGGPGNIRISPETTYVVEPLREDGQVDFLRAYNNHVKEGFEGQENGTVLLVQAFGPASLESQFGANSLGSLSALYRELGMAPLSTDGDYFVTWDFAGRVLSPLDFESLPDELKQELPPSKGDEALTLRRLPPSVATWLNEELESCLAAPWQRREHPAVARWLEESAIPLEKVIAAANCPVRWIPYAAKNETDTLVAVPLADMMMSLRSATRALVARSYLRAGTGDLDGAINDAIATIQLGQSHTPRTTILVRLVNAAIFSMGCECAAHLATSGTLDAAALDRLARELDAFSPTADFVETIAVSERIEAISAVDAWASDPNIADKLDSIPRMPKLVNYALDWNDVLIKINGYYDQIATLRTAVTSWQRLEMAEQLKTTFEATMSKPRPWRLLTLSGRSELIGEALALMMMPTFSGAFGIEVHAESTLLMTKISVALERYRLANGEYPTALNQLGPDLLTVERIDPFDGKPLRYRRTEHGYLLYSVGKNRDDDGGHTENDLVSQMPTPSQ